MNANVKVAPRAFAITWEKLDRWNVDYFHSSRWHWPSHYLKRIVDFAFPEAISISIDKAQERNIPIISKINFDGHLFLRNNNDYADYKGHLFVTSANRLIFSKINAKRGCIYFHPSNQRPFAVSSEYPVLKLNSEIAFGDYVNLALRIGPARETLLGSASGMAKARTNIRDFLNIVIPLPPLYKQKKIVARWQKAQDEIAILHERVEKVKTIIDTRFFADLGLSAPAISTIPKAFVIGWKDFPRWGVDFNFLNQSGTDLSRGKYPLIELDTILDLTQYGTSEKATDTEDGIPVLRIGNIKERAFDLSDLKYMELPNKKALLLKDGDILMIRTSGSHNLVGTCAVFREKGDYIFASYLIRLRLNPSRVIPEFASWFLNSPLGRQQVNAVSRHIMQNNINSEEIRRLRIPLPPLETQTNIMKLVADGRAEIARELEAAEKLSKNIKAEVEAMILGTKTIIEN